jgi:sugar/nucleoside kinase (ribokinase family)
MRKRVIVIGDAMLDVVVRPEEPMAPTSDTRSRVHFSRGGSAANLAVALGANHDVVYVGVVGDDEPGEMFARDLEEAGIGAELQIEEGSTGVVVAIVSGDGQRAMMTDRGVNSLLSMDTVDDAFAEPFDHLHVSGYTILDDATRRVAMMALDSARASGASTSVDTCSAAPLARLGAPQFLRAAGKVPMLFANEEEALLLSGAADVERAGTVLREVSGEVVITRGSNGAMVVRDGRAWAQPSLPVDVVDTTGAGDAATGAYLAARLDGLDCGEALNRAMRRASSVVGVLGSRA